MPDYRRLISYIYAYEGGIKGKNTGYAKIEVRGDICRIAVSVKKVFVGSNDIGVYLLSPGKEILLGKIFIRGGNGEFRTKTETKDVEASGCGIDQCYGLTIHDVENTWQCYTTIWEDAVAQTAELQLEHVTAENVRKRQEKEESKSEEEPFPISAEIERQLQQEEAALEDVQPWEAEESSPGEKSLKENSPGENSLEENMSEKSPLDAEKPEKAETESEEGYIEELQNPELLKTLDQEEQEAKNLRNPDSLWSRLQRSYSKVLAFDYDHGCEILSIKPQDIGLLPMEIWVYGNNSFLLHGYYNYRHLILARLNIPGGSFRYLLGVPGHYYSNEKYMASMFGFPHFVLARKQPEEDGRFGYWYTNIRL